jgi:hypothetical protein
MFESFSIAGLTRKVNIDAKNRTIKVKVSEDADLSGLIPTFTLSPGATAWIKSIEQKSSAAKTDFTKPVIYKIAGEDSVTTSEWTVIIKK